MTTKATTTASDAATMTAKELFFDKLESYFDFRDEEPVTARKRAIDLLQACGAIGNHDERVTDLMYQAIICDVLGDLSRKAWVSEGCRLRQAAALLVLTLDRKFSFGLVERLASALEFDAATA